MRVMKFIAPAAVALSLAPVAISGAWAGSDPTGIWLDNDGRGAVEIKPCGNALCGNVVWVKSSTDAEGCGKQIIGGVTPVGNGHWDNGWIYSPEKGRKYDVELTPLSNGDLKVVGYAGLKFLSRTMIWKPAPADLQLCTQSNPALPVPGAAPGATNASTPATITPNVNSSAGVSTPSQEAETTAKPAPVPNASPSPSGTAAADAAPNAPPVSPEKSPPDTTAKADGSDGGSDDLGKMKIGDTALDKIFTKKDGKCKVDLPWVKVTVDCER